ncbi:MAG: hydroxysqualene dehydroxylase HpnE [Proteobacteria bacterium]|nr:hydroxysqualene dehydroxylase HpnE [Pseudomonadota bacterium]
MAPRTHIIGAGLAGLSAAVNLLKAGRDVSLYEAAGHAGGRCRSYHDATFDRRIDNGNHLVLSGNLAVMDYLRDIGASDSLTGPSNPEFPFFDLASAERWTVVLDAGFLPRAMLSKAGRVPGAGRWDYLKAFRLARVGKETTVAQCLGPDNALYRRFWEPLAVAVLNTDGDEAAATLLWPVIRETFARGGSACRPMVAKEGLSESFVDPALAVLKEQGVEVSFNCRLRELTMDADRVTALTLGKDTVNVDDGDSVILAVPANAAAGLAPGLIAPDQFRAIVNGHFLLDQKAEDSSFLGLIGGVADWLFVRGDIASVTVSAADDLAEQSAESIAEKLWGEVAKALDLGDAPLPACRIVKEKRATFAQTPDQIRRRPPARTALNNLFLAGDWTDTGLPATIEGTLRSGLTASEAILLDLN